MFTPFFNQSLTPGLWIWNIPIYNEYKNIVYYQLQCVLNEQELCIPKQFMRQHAKNKSESFVYCDAKSNSNEILLQMSYLLASQLVFVTENDSQLFLEKLSNLRVIKQDIIKSDNDTVPNELPSGRVHNLIDFKP